MNTRILFIAVVLIGLTSASATASDKKKYYKKHHHKNNHFVNAKPITFVERGVQFFVFPDGTFDFNTHFNQTHHNNHDNSMFYKSNNTKRTYVNRNYHQNYNRGVTIDHDRYGNVRRIGNVFLNYDRSGKIKRVGTVYMNYKRGRNFVSLSQVGGLRVEYNSCGEILYSYGQVKRFTDFCNFCGVQSCSVNHNHRNSNYNDYNERYNGRHYRNDDNHYYFKQKGKLKKRK